MPKENVSEDEVMAQARDYLSAYIDSTEASEDHGKASLCQNILQSNCFRVEPTTPSLLSKIFGWQFSEVTQSTAYIVAIVAIIRLAA